MNFECSPIPTLAPPRLVIFDCDGVLVDSEAISNQVLARMLSEQGLPTTLTESRRTYQGLLLADIVELAQQQLGRALPEDWLEQYEAQRNVEFRRALQPVAGVAGAIEQIRAAGIAMCVASQGKLSKTRLSLGLTGLADLFEPDALFSAYQVPRGKPHPDLFLHAASTFGVPPAECVVVEDTPSGVTAGMRAGMRVLGYAADSDEHALRNAGAEILRSLEELPGRLGLP